MYNPEDIDKDSLSNDKTVRHSSKVHLGVQKSVSQKQCAIAHHSVEEKSIPQHGKEFYTHSDPHFKDHTIPEHFTKNTGIEIKDIPAFCTKEFLDNSADAIERHYRDANADDATITTHIDLTDPFLTLTVSNRNRKNIPFPSLQKIYDYEHSLSSKAQQCRMTRGIQGDALQQAGTAGCLMSGGRDWRQPIIFQHNGVIDKVYIDIYRLYNKIDPRFENGKAAVIDNGGCGPIYTDTDTKITLTLPPITAAEAGRLLKFWEEYTLFNTHLSYKLHFGDGFSNSGLSPGSPSIFLPALHPINKDYDNPNSVYCYTWEELEILLNDSVDKDMSVYDALDKAGFRELNQPGRFEDLKNITLRELTSSKVKKIHERLRKSMLPMSKLPVPYDTKVRKRKAALLARYNQIKPRTIEIDMEKLVYKKNEDVYVDGEKGTRYLYYFETLMIPIKNNMDSDNIIICGVNYSTSVTNQQYFAGPYTNTYDWTSKDGEDLTAFDIDEIVRKSMARKEIGENENISSRKLKVPCVIIAHLVGQKIEYRGGYGKSQLVLHERPYATTIAETIEDAVRHLPSKEKYYPSGKKNRPDLIDLLTQLLTRRWKEVQAMPEILNPYNKDLYDPWSQSTVWYHLMEEYIMPIQEDNETYDNTTPYVTQYTRNYITGKISEICETVLGVTREQLGIYASPRATMYSKGQWHSVYLKDVPELASKGTVVVFIEKVGVVDQIKHIIDSHGIAFVNTQGHFAEYPKNLVSAIIKEGGYIAILTDFDCAGIHIAENVIREILKALKPEDETKIIRLGVDNRMLEYFVSQGIEIEDKRNNAIRVITSVEELKSITQEPYPKHKEKNKQRPAMNVVSAIIEYAKRYTEYIVYPDTYPQYARYKYIYDNFEYLTGLSTDIIFQDEKTMKETILKRPDGKAKRIELDSVIKVVRANAFANFIVNQLEEQFPILNYNRAVDKPTEYFTDKFYILPKNVRTLLLHITDTADNSIKQTDEEIENELEAIDASEVGGMLNIDVEEKLNERLRMEAIDTSPDMQAIDAKCGELLDSLGVDR